MKTNVRVDFSAGSLMGTLIASLLLTPIAACGQTETSEPEPVADACEHACCLGGCTGPRTCCDIFDFLEFQNMFVRGDPCACDMDTSTGPGVCDIFDFLAFQDEFVDGMINGTPC